MSGLIGGRVVMAERALVQAIGLTEAVVLQQFHWHLVECEDRRERDGHDWCPITITVLADELGLSVDTTRRTVRALEDSGLLVSCQPEGMRSRRKWYRIDTDVLDALIGAPKARNRGIDAADVPLPEQADLPLVLSEPSRLRRTRARSPRDDLYDVLVEVFGTPTKSGAALYAKVASELVDMPDATPDELRRRIQVAHDTWGRKTFGPKAITQNWPMLGASVGPRSMQELAMEQERARMRGEG